MKLLAMAVVCNTAAFWLAAGVSSVDGSPLPERTCASIQWNPMFLKSYPTAAAACRGIIEKGGIEFAEFRGKVSQVNHDVVQVQVLDVMNTPISTITFLMGRDGHVVIDPSGAKIENLKRGDQLTFWIREGLFGVSPTLIDHPMLLVRPESVEQLIENLKLPQHFIDLR